MKCECECHCGVIPSRDAMNDRLYWVEVRGVGRYAAWRGMNDRDFPWVVSDEDPSRIPFYTDDGIRIIHEITPEE